MHSTISVLNNCVYVNKLSTTCLFSKLLWTNHCHSLTLLYSSERLMCQKSFIWEAIWLWSKKASNLDMWSCCCHVSLWTSAHDLCSPVLLFHSSSLSAVTCDNKLQVLRHIDDARYFNFDISDIKSCSGSWLYSIWRKKKIDLPFQITGLTRQ